MVNKNLPTKALSVLITCVSKTVKEYAYWLLMLSNLFCVKTFQYVHYEIDYPEKENKGALMKKEAQLSVMKTVDGEQVNMFPPQVRTVPSMGKVVSLSPTYTQYTDEGCSFYG